MRTTSRDGQPVTTRSSNLSHVTIFVTGWIAPLTSGNVSCDGCDGFARTRHTRLQRPR